METQEFFNKLGLTESGTRYLDLVQNVKAENRGIRRGQGYELHHIMPRAFGGGNEEANLVKLTVYEHCLVHILLAKAIPCYKTYQPLTKLAGKQMKLLTEADEQALGPLLEDFVRMRDEVLHAKKSEETRRKIAEANRRRLLDPEYRKRLHKPRSEETKHRMRKPKSEEHRKKLGEKNRQKGQEYQKQKRHYMETGEVVGDQLKAMLRRTETIRRINEQRKQVMLLDDFKAWYMVHGFTDQGKRLNRLVSVGKYLRETGQRIEDLLNN